MFTGEEEISVPRLERICRLSMSVAVCMILVSDEFQMQPHRQISKVKVMTVILLIRI